MVRKGNMAEKLESLVLAASESINSEAEKVHRLKDLVEKDGTLSMPGFAKNSGGIYSDSQMANFNNEVSDSEAAHSMAFRVDRGTPEYNRIIKDWKERSKQSKSSKIEQAIMLLFYKFLKDEFLVVRSAVHDDYKAGVDNLIVNKKTGEVICAIDDFHEGEHDRNKAEKTKRKAEKGGATVNFGLGVKNGKVIRTKLENLPVFYLGITSENFEALMQSMGSDINSPLSPKEQEVFLQFVGSLEEQQQALGKLDLKTNIQNNVNNLKSVLEKIRQIAESASQPKQAKAA